MNRSWVKKQRVGAAAIEFALVAPIAFALFFGCIEFSRAYMVRQTIQNAVYEAARTGLVPNATNANMQAAAENFLRRVQVRGATVVASQTDTQVSCRIDIDYNRASWIPPVFLSGSTIRAEITLEKDIQEE